MSTGKKRRRRRRDKLGHIRREINQVRPGRP
jgi:hypothetical protein